MAKILDSFWLTQITRPQQIGAVLIASDQGILKCYLGTPSYTRDRGELQADDEWHIYRNGAGLPVHLAKAFFPQIDSLIKKHNWRYDPTRGG